MIDLDKIIDSMGGEKYNVGLRRALRRAEIQFEDDADGMPMIHPDDEEFVASDDFTGLLIEELGEIAYRMVIEEAHRQGVLEYIGVNEHGDLEHRWLVDKPWIGW